MRDKIINELDTYVNVHQQWNEVYHSVETLSKLLYTVTETIYCIDSLIRRGKRFSDSEYAHRILFVGYVLQCIRWSKDPVYSIVKKTDDGYEITRFIADNGSYYDPEVEVNQETFNVSHSDLKTILDIEGLWEGFKDYLFKRDIKDLYELEDDLRPLVEKLYNLRKLEIGN